MIIWNNEEPVPGVLAVFLDQASHVSDRKGFWRGLRHPPRSARRGRQTVHESACRRSPHTPRQFQGSGCEGSFRHETLCRPCPIHSRPAKKLLPPVKVQSASVGFANNLGAKA